MGIWSSPCLGREGRKGYSEYTKRINCTYKNENQSKKDTFRSSLMYMSILILYLAQKIVKILNLACYFIFYFNALCYSKLWF